MGRKSVIDRDIVELKEVVKNSRFFINVLDHFGLSHKGTGNYKTLKKKLNKYGIDYSHILNNKRQLARELGRSQQIPMNKILVKASYYNRSHLKKRLIQDGVLEEKCDKCGCKARWQGQPLSLQLHHRNGDPIDNELTNLQLLCPNCHSQIKIVSKRKSINKKCKQCDKPITKYSKSGLCKKCSSVITNKKKRKVVRPPKDVLIKLISKTSYCAVGKKYGVSDNAIRKWLK